MTDFQAQFDGYVAEANSAAANKVIELKEALPAMHPAVVRRLLTNISLLLGKVDRKEIKHPEFLANAPQNIPERAVELASGIKPSFDEGVENFIKNHLPHLVDVEAKLIAAVGVGAYKIPDIKNSQVRALDQILDRANQKYSDIGSVLSELKTRDQDTSGLIQEIGDKLKQAISDQAKIEEVKKLAERLSRSNASQNPLERLVRSAREKSEEIDEVLSKAREAEKSSSDHAISAKNHQERSASVLEALETSNERARDILNNATQAGLAGAYKVERDKLASQQRNFAYTFYGIILLIVIYAAVFILPIVQDVLGINGGESVSTRDGAILLAVRLLILAPAIWALIFTNRRYIYLETLQMDYAAKASTALAYSGYRDEMGHDNVLSDRLKDGLVVRFLEHPSRLLGKKIEVNTSEVGPEGAKYASSTRSPEAAEGSNSESSESESH